MPATSIGRTTPAVCRHHGNAHVRTTAPATPPPLEVRGAATTKDGDSAAEPGWRAAATAGERPGTPLSVPGQDPLQQLTGRFSRQGKRRFPESLRSAVETRPAPVRVLALSEPRWRNWQTHQLEGLAPFTGRAGSSPVLGTIQLARPTTRFFGSTWCRESPAGTHQRVRILPRKRMWLLSSSTSRNAVSTSSTIDCSCSIAGMSLDVRPVPAWPHCSFR